MLTTHLAFAGGMLTAFQVLEWFAAPLLPTVWPLGRLAIRSGNREIAWTRPRSRLTPLISVIRRMKGLALLLFALLALGFYMLPIVLAVVGNVLGTANRHLNRIYVHTAKENEDHILSVIRKARFVSVMRIASASPEFDSSMITRSRLRQALERPDRQVPFIGLIGLSLIVAAYVLGVTS